MAFDQPEDTKLIDVSNLQDEISEEFSQEATVQDEALSEMTPIAEARSARPIVAPEAAIGTSRVATLGERFTAFLIDSFVLWVLYWVGVLLFHHLSGRGIVAMAPTVLNWTGVAFHGAFAVVAFLYYFLFEGVFSTTIGKFFCWMYVRRTDGRIASLTSVFLRNLLRPIDYAFAGLVALVCMEFTARHQRFGDLAAGTTVIKRQIGAGTAQPVAWDQLASITGRLVAGVIDLALLAGLAIGLILLISDERPFMSLWLVLTAPGLLLIFWSALQSLTHTTPGTWLLGYQIVQENGAPIGLSHGIMRTLLLPLDFALVGPFALAFSPRHQRVGDMVAGTLVVRHGHPVRGALALLFSLGLVLAMGFAAQSNPRRPLSPELTLTEDFNWSFFPRFAFAPNFPPLQATPEPFRIVGFRFAEGSPENTRSPAVYVPGETAYFVFEVHGFKTKQNNVWIQEDLAIRYPDNTFGLKQENIIDHHQIKRLPGPLVLKNNINLPQGIPAGQYTVYLTVRDKLSNFPPILHSQTFFIKGPRVEEPQAPPVPAESQQDEPEAKPTTPPQALPAP